MQRYWIDGTTKSRRNDHIYQRKKCSQNNAPAHKSAIAMEKMYELRYQLLCHPLYQPDLAPLDFFQFLNMKKWLTGKKFTSNEEVEWDTHAYFAELPKLYYLEGTENQNIVGPSVSRQKGTTLKNKIKFVQKNYLHGLLRLPLYGHTTSNMRHYRQDQQTTN